MCVCVCMVGLALWGSGKESAFNAGGVRDTGWMLDVPGSVRSPGVAIGYPLQFSCLENPMDRGTGRLQSMGLQKVRHDWVHTHIYMVQRGLQLKAETWELRLVLLPPQEHFLHPKWFLILAACPYSQLVSAMYLLGDIGEVQTCCPSPLSPASWDRRVSLSSPSLLSVLGRLLSYTQRKISYPSEGSLQSHEKVWGAGCWPSLWPGLLTFLIFHTSSHFISKTSPIWHDFSLFLLPPFPPGMKTTMSVLCEQ